MRFYAACLLLLLFAALAPAEPCEFRLVDAAGKPVEWGTREIMYRYQGGLHAPVFTADVPHGRTLLLGRYLLSNDNGVISSPNAEVIVTGHAITVNVQPLADALYCARGLAWAVGKLYVAETESIDGTNNMVRIFTAGDRKGERLATVNSPRALAVSGTTLYVLGEDELAAFDVKTKVKKYGRHIDYGAQVSQMALVKNQLFVGDAAAACVRILTAATGEQVGQFAGEGANTLVAGGYAGIGVAALPGGHLLVCDAAGVREFTPAGVFVRKLSDIRNGSSVAVDARGNIALAVVSAADQDYTLTPEVWKLAPDGKPLQRFVRVYMSGPRPDPACRLNYFNGMTGSLYATGGVAFDDHGNLFVSNYNHWPTTQNGAYFPATLAQDGGVIQLSPTSDVSARLGSRFSDAFIRARLVQRAKRQPLLRTSAALQSGTLRLLGWGDSITQTGPDWNGGATDTAHNWVHVLARKLEAQYPPLKVEEKSDGVGGQNAAEGHTRNPVPLYYEQPDLLLLEFGTNDSNFHHYTPARYRQALRDMVTDLLTLTDSDIGLLTVGPLLDLPLDGTEAEYIQAAQAVGREFNIPVVNIAAVMHSKLAENGGTPFEKYHTGPTNVHPNNAGHAVWAQAVLEEIAGKLEKR